MKPSFIKCIDLSSGQNIELPKEGLLFRPTVYGLIIVNRSILLVPSRHGYILPGGAVELGESLEEALCREVYEETGLRVSVKKLLDATQDYYVSAFSKNAYHAVILVYSCVIIDGEISTEQFSEYEKKYYKKAEWVSFDDTKKIQTAYPKIISHLIDC